MLQLASMFVGYLNLLYSFPFIFLLKYVDFWGNKQEEFNDVRYTTNKIFTKEYFHKYSKETVLLFSQGRIQELVRDDFF